MRKISSSGKTRWSEAFSSRALARSRPNGFSTTTRAPSVRPAAAQAVDHVVEQAGRDGQVEHRVRRRAEPLGQALEGRRVPVVAAHVAERRREAGEGGLVEGLAPAADAAPGRACGGRRRPRPGRHADDRHPVEDALLGQAERAGKSFL